MPTLLMIDERFPNTGGTRTEKFVKFLPHFDWKPIILSIKPSRETPMFKEGLARCRSQRVNIHFTPKLPDFSVFRKIELARYGNILNRLMFIPDVTVTWLPFAVSKALQIIRREKPDAVYSTSPSESTHLVAICIKLFTGLPWIADFRDLWTLYELHYKALTPYHHYLNRYLEGKIYREWSDAVIANTPENKDIIVRQFGAAPDRIVTIPNGFDPADAVHKNKVNKPKEYLTFGYMGGLEKPAICYQSFLEGFLKAYERCPKLKLRLWGEISVDLQARFRQDPIFRQTVEVEAYLPHHQAMQQVAEADVSVVLLKSGFDHVVPQKLYNYLALNKPIFAVVPLHGRAAKIIEQTQTGLVVAPNSSQVIAKALEDAYNRFQAGEFNHFEDKVDHEAVDVYRRDNLTAQLVERLNIIKRAL